MFTLNKNTSHTEKTFCVMKRTFFIFILCHFEIFIADYFEFRISIVYRDVHLYLVCVSYQSFTSKRIISCAGTVVLNKVM